MTLDKFKRVIWRLQEMDTHKPDIYTNKQIRLAIMEEIGTDERTISVTMKKMIELGWLTRIQVEFGSMRITKQV